MYMCQLVKILRDCLSPVRLLESEIMTDRMVAAVLRDFNDLRVEEIQILHPKNLGEVLVSIKSCGFCATDYKAIRGIRKNVSFPFIPGHEPSGIVAQTGPGVINFAVGDEVICQLTGSYPFDLWTRTE